MFQLEYLEILNIVGLDNIQGEIQAYIEVQVSLSGGNTIYYASFITRAFFCVKIKLAKEMILLQIWDTLENKI